MIEYAKKELEIINHPKKNEFLNILKKIDEQGHSNISINFIRYAIKFNDFKTYNNDKEYEEYARLIQLNLNELKPLVEDLSDKEREIILKLIDYKPLSPLEIGDDQWEYSYGSYNHKRFYALSKNKLTDKPRYIHAVVCNNGTISFSAGEVSVKETGKTYLLRKAHPKKYDDFPTIYINVTEEEDNIYTTEEELDKVRVYYDLEEGEQNYE